MSIMGFIVDKNYDPSTQKTLDEEELFSSEWMGV